MSSTENRIFISIKKLNKIILEGDFTETKKKMIQLFLKIEKKVKLLDVNVELKIVN